MRIESRRQCENTRTKLLELEELYEKKRLESGNEHLCELTLRSLKKRINQFKEEIARFEARAPRSLMRKASKGSRPKRQLLLTARQRAPRD